MKTLTVRLPDPLAAQIDAESRRRRVSKSDVVRERLEGGSGDRGAGVRAVDAIGDLIGSVASLPADLSARRKHYLKTAAYGRKRSR